MDHPKMILDGLRQNLLQKAYSKIKNDKDTIMTDILELEVRAAQRPTLAEHIRLFGAKEWFITSQKLAQAHK